MNFGLKSAKEPITDDKGGGDGNLKVQFEAHLKQ